MKRKSLMGLVGDMIDVARQYVHTYQTDVAYDTAIIASGNSDIYVWLVRDHGTHLFTIDSTSDKKDAQIREEINNIYDIFGENIHAYLIDYHCGWKIEAVDNKKELFLYI